MKKDFRNRLEWIKDNAKKAFFQCVIEAVAQKNNDFFFIQIGACDGISGDPIRKFILKYHWRGVLVEPVKDLYKKLQKNYLEIPGLKFENIAIAGTDGAVQLYRFKKDYKELPEGHFISTASLINNFKGRYGSLFGNIDDYITSEKTSCLTLGSLLRKHHIQAVDLLCIDTEGFDDQILASIDFKISKPRFILYEQQWLSERSRLACHELLQAQGYKSCAMAQDVFAYLKKELNPGVETALKLKAYWRTIFSALRHNMKYFLFKR